MLFKQHTLKEKAMKNRQTKDYTSLLVGNFSEKEAMKFKFPYYAKAYLIFLLIHLIVLVTVN